MIHVYLDQNKWIDLAKAAARRPDGTRFEPVLQDARKAVREGVAIFPLSSVHIMETAKSPRLDQRRQLAELMTELSQGVVLRASTCLVREYLPFAIRQCFDEGLEAPLPPVFSRHIEDAFDFDLSQLLGVSPERAERLRLSLDTPAAWCDLLANDHEVGRKAGTNAVNAIGVRMAQSNEKWREVLVNDDLATIQRAYAATLTMSFLEPISQHLTAIGRTLPEWGGLGPARLMDFWRSIPCLHVELELHSQMLREKSRNWSANDSLDIGALSLAIPACDIVVTERFWTSLVQRRGLDGSFATSVLTDLTKLSIS